MTKQPAGRTPVRNLRVPDELWEPALNKARSEGKTLTEVLIAYLKRYTASERRRTPEEEADE